MKYQISASMIADTPLDSSGDRGATAGFSGETPFFVVNTGFYTGGLTMRRAVFGPSSNLRIVEARAMPILASGLREGSSVYYVTHPAFEAVIDTSLGNPFRLYLTKYNEWQPVDILNETDGTTNIELTLLNFLACYDAYKIKDDYKGLPFGFRFDLRVESSGGIIVP